MESVNLLLNRDLSDRSIVLHLQHIINANKRTEKSVLREFDDKRERFRRPALLVAEKEDQVSSVRSSRSNCFSLRPKSS